MTGRPAFAGWSPTGIVADARPLRSAAANAGGGILRLLVGLCIACAVERLPAWQTGESDGHPDWFGIQVVDRASGRGVPLIRLTTVNNIVLVTDSAGWVAFQEPGLMNREVFFRVAGHGYTCPQDGFGYSGVRLNVQPGQTARIEVDRTNLAERLYRITGQGIYRDSGLLGLPVPLAQPDLPGGVLGQDTVQAAVYGDRIYWFWGDTNRAGYPLGNFRTSGAVSRLPDQGGLPAETGIDLDYFVGETGFTRPMAPVEGPGMVWINGLFVLESDGRQQMYARFSRRKSLAEQIEHGLVRFADSDQTFHPLARFADSARLYPRGQATVVGEHVYFATPFPTVRVVASAEAIVDPAGYEAWTCLAPGTGYLGRRSSVERDEEGQVVWGWKRDTSAITSRQERALVDAGLLQPAETRIRISESEPFDPQAPSPELHSGSVRWNPWRNRWVMIGLQVGGEHSFLGDVWFAESDQLTGPWLNARRVAVHHNYSFYNPAHHDFLDQREGRDIFFQGTYVTTFSAAKQPTPRYDYNQIMYRLSLDDPALQLPPPAAADSGND